MTGGLETRPYTGIGHPWIPVHGLERYDVGEVSNLPCPWETKPTEETEWVCIAAGSSNPGIGLRDDRRIGNPPLRSV